MAKSYYTEDQKQYTLKRQAWTLEECIRIHEILSSKGYFMNCVSRVGADGKWHDAWQVQRDDMPRLIEQLFRQRIAVEVQAEGHGKAAITFVYNYSSTQIIDACNRFQKNTMEE